MAYGTVLWSELGEWGTVSIWAKINFCRLKKRDKNLCEIMLVRKYFLGFVLVLRFLSGAKFLFPVIQRENVNVNFTCIR
jgi:hypothetical protein